MKEVQDYLQDIAEIRSMMERSSKFLSLSGWAGIMAGAYALAGAYIAYTWLDFNPGELFYAPSESGFSLAILVLVAVGVLLLALATAAYLSYSRASKRGEKLWNPTAKKLLFSLVVPLVAGGLLLLVLLTKGLIGLLAPSACFFTAWRCSMRAGIPIRK